VSEIQPNVKSELSKPVDAASDVLEGLNIDPLKEMVSLYHEAVQAYEDELIPKGQELNLRFSIMKEVLPFKYAGKRSILQEHDSSQPITVNVVQYTGAAATPPPPTVIDVKRMIDDDI
jgi:hypothetical protein